MEGDTEEDEDALLADRPLSGEVTRKYCGFTRAEMVFIIAITIVSVGVNFAIDIPASLEDAMSQYYGLNQYDFSLFYTSYFFPSMVLNIFGGYLIDKVMGVRKSTIVYSLVAGLGLIMFVSGGILKLFWFMILGRLIFGLGSEMSSSVCMSYCTFTYFNRSSVNFMFSLTDNFSYLGTMAVFQLAPFLFYFFNSTRTPYQALNLVLIICSSTYLVTGCLSIWISFMGPDNESEVIGDTRDAVHLTHISLYDIIRFPAIFWLLCIAYFCFMNANFTFETFSQGLLTSDLFKLSVEEASNAVTIMNAAKITLSVPLSLIVDKIGRNIVFVALSMFLCTVSFSMFIINTVHPYAIMGLLGISYSLTGSAIWAMFAYPVSKHLRGSCYGIVSAICGLSQTLSPSAVGNLIDRFGFMAAIYFFTVNASVALLTAVVTWVMDCKSGGLLSMSPWERIVRDNQFARAEQEEEGLINQDWNEPLPDSYGPH